MRELTLYSPREKVPEDGGVSHEAQRIAKDQLRPQAPPEETEVAWMPQILVNAVLDQSVPLNTPRLNRVVEVRPCLSHRQGSYGLSEYYHREADTYEVRVGDPRLPVRQKA